MYNWSVDERKFRTEDPQEYEIWQIQQMINYGLGHHKLDAKKVRKFWSRLTMDAPTQHYLEFLLWPKSKRS